MIFAGKNYTAMKMNSYGYTEQAQVDLTTVLWSEVLCVI